MHRFYISVHLFADSAAPLWQFVNFNKIYKMEDWKMVKTDIGDTLEQEILVPEKKNV
jgi:hypothetical protein